MAWSWPPPRPQSPAAGPGWAGSSSCCTPWRPGSVGCLCRACLVCGSSVLFFGFVFVFGITHDLRGGACAWARAASLHQRRSITGLHSLSDVSLWSILVIGTSRRPVGKPRPSCYTSLGLKCRRENFNISYLQRGIPSPQSYVLLQRYFKDYVNPEYILSKWPISSSSGSENNLSLAALQRLALPPNTGASRWHCGDGPCRLASTLPDG